MGKPVNRRAKLLQAKQRLREKHGIKQGAKKLCLTMIVKNESKNMIRLLNSLKCIIDMASIVDTGSTDNTEEVILKWSEENNIPITVHHEPFQDFSHNRTHSVRAAKQSYPEADYFLLSDADFVWDININGTFDKSLLIDHKYLVEQYNRNLSYWNIRVLSSKVEWQCTGVTHEYWEECKTQYTFDGEVRTTKLRTIAIDDREDGGCKSDKFERDERLLKAGLENPDTAPGLATRYKFYLAQTLKDMGRHIESIEWYNKRIADKGWYEEVFYSKFQVGVNYEQIAHAKKHCVKLLAKTELTEADKNYLQKWNADNNDPGELMELSNNAFVDASVNYMAAFEFRKSRSESIYYLTRMYRLLGMNDMAYECIQLGKDIEYPHNDSLFIERACYDYNWDFELSIVCYYIPEAKDEGRQAVARLLNRNDIPQWMLPIIEQNSRHYV